MAEPRHPPHAPGGKSARWLIPAGVTVFLLLIGAILFDRAVAQPFSHDEHQFVSAGWWLAKEGLLPYRDFPYHHMPYQIPLNALAIWLSPCVLLSGRVVSWLGAWLASMVMFVAVWREARPRSGFAAPLAAAAAVVIFVSQPIVAYTTGQAWNHDWANLLALGAVVLQVRMIDDRFRPWLGVAVGLLAGLSAGVRLSYAVLCPLLMASAAMIPAPARFRWKNASLVLVGIVIAGIPAAILLALDPRAFAYGNLLYPQLNSLYREVLRYWSDSGLLAKLAFFGETVLADPGSAVLMAGALASVVFGWTAGLRNRTSVHAMLLVLLATVLLLLTGFSPTPARLQYFFAWIPFAILTVAMAVSRVARWKGPALIGVSLLAVVCVLTGEWDEQIVRRLQSPETWVPSQVHRVGQRLADDVAGGRVLTLGPILAMEGGLSTYEAFATGPFTWRVAHIIPQSNRRLVGWVAQDDLEAYLAGQRPAAILTGLETANEGFKPGERGNLEAPLEALALEWGFRPEPVEAPFLSTRLTLWLAP